MPLFHFYLVECGERDHLGSADLPYQGTALPAGLKIVMKILANVIVANKAGDCLALEAMDEAGGLVYTFDVSNRRERESEARGYMH